jgi:hypothetical protein
VGNQRCKFLQPPGFAALANLIVEPQRIGTTKLWIAVDFPKWSNVLDVIRGVAGEDIQGAEEEPINACRPGQRIDRRVVEV